MVKQYSFEPEQLITDKLLKSCLDRLVLKSQKGYMSFIIFFGPTRSGKSMLSFKCMHYCAQKLGMPFNNEHIFWRVEDLMREAQGVKKGCYVVDEGSLDLLANEWYEEAQRKMIKYHMTAAKWAQIVCVNIQNLGKVPGHIATDFHTRLIETRINSKTLDQGYYRIMDKAYNQFIYDTIKRNDQRKIRKIGGYPKNGTRMDLYQNRIAEFINLEQYEKDKDAAIASIVDGSDKNPFKEHFKKIARHIGKEKKPILDIKELASVTGMKEKGIMNHYVYGQDSA